MFAPTIEGHDSFHQFSHMCSYLDLGRRTHNILRTCFPSSLQGGHQPPNQGQPEMFVFLPASGWHTVKCSGNVNRLQLLVVWPVRCSVGPSH